MEFFIDYDTHRWSNNDIYNKYVELLYKPISDLEAKLAESEKQVEFYKERYSDATTSAYGADLMAKDYQWHLEKEIAELKQQLEEKDKAIENLRIDLKDYIELEEKISTKYDKVVEQLAEKEKENEVMAKTLKMTKFIEKEINQDEISFAVEQLEKVKEACEEIPQCDEYGDDWVLQSGLFEYIDNQIEELKKEMK